MADLSIDFCGIKSPNPFWLASAPPTNSEYQVNRAFEAGWGGAVWKTIGAPVMNTANRYGGLDGPEQKLIGLNNIELISDRDIQHAGVSKSETVVEEQFTSTKGLQMIVPRPESPFTPMEYGSQEAF